MKKIVAVTSVTALVLSLIVILAVAPAAAGGTVVYNNIPDPIPGNVPSVGFEATSTSEFGGQIELAGTSRNDPTVTVLMSSWACESGAWFSHDCVTTPGATFTHPITLNVYTVNADNSPGSVVATVTQTFTMPYRPSADNANCVGDQAGEWFDGTSCFNGLAFPISFDLTGVTLPDKVIVGVAYNTSHYGDQPIGTQACNSTPQGCPYDSLNVGTNPSPSVGTALPTANDAYQNSSWSGAYCDNGAAGTGSFRLNAGCWTGFLPAIEVQAGPDHTAQWKTFGDAAWKPHQGYNSQQGLVTTSDSSGSYGGIELLDGPVYPGSITAASFVFKADQTGQSGGSPRLVIQFSDGGDAELRPLNWTAKSWTTEDGFGANASDWDNNGGTCGFKYETTYAAASACHTGATITAIFLVNDSGWAYTSTGETVVVDNVTVNSIVAAGPGNSN